MIFGEDGTFNGDLVIAHKLVHQWHGNLVTHAWWKEWWLTEGFASYFQAFGVEALYPKNLARQMNIKIKGQYGAFKKDTFQGFPTVYNGHGNFTAYMDIEANSYLFYERGASILTMLAGMIGQETFLTGVRKYLKRHAFSTAVTDDLWTQLEVEARASGFFTHLTERSIKEIMELWCFISNTEMEFSQGRTHTV